MLEYTTKVWSGLEELIELAVSRTSRSLPNLCLSDDWRMFDDMNRV